MSNEQQAQTVRDTYYSSITELPLCNYVNCLIEKDLSHLVKSGNPSLDDLAVAWNDITTEYADAVGDNEYNMYLVLAKELALLEIRFAKVENLVSIMKLVYDELYAKTINEILKTSFKFDVSDYDTYQKELDRCLTRNKSNAIQIQLKKSQLEGQEKRFSSDNKAPTREYFISVLITLSDHAKFEIRDTITVYQFCDRIRRLNDYIKTLEKQNNK